MTQQNAPGSAPGGSTRRRSLQSSAGRQLPGAPPGRPTGAGPVRSAGDQQNIGHESPGVPKTPAADWVRNGVKQFGGYRSSSKYGGGARPWQSTLQATVPWGAGFSRADPEW